MCSTEAVSGQHHPFGIPIVVQVRSLWIMRWVRHQPPDNRGRKTGFDLQSFVCVRGGAWGWEVGRRRLGRVGAFPTPHAGGGGGEGGMAVIKRAASLQSLPCSPPPPTPLFCHKRKSRSFSFYSLVVKR